MTVDHTSASELLGVYALDACDEDETSLIEVHLVECDECRDEAGRLKNLAGWMGVGEAKVPSAHLRSRIIRVAESEEV